MKLNNSYEEFLDCIKFTEEDMQNEMRKYITIHVNKEILIKPSSIEGVGCFTTKHYPPNTIIGRGTLFDKFKTELGRYVNHSHDPNIGFKNNYFTSLKHIPPNTELTTNYIYNIYNLIQEGKYDKYMFELDN